MTAPITNTIIVDPDGDVLFLLSPMASKCFISNLPSADSSAISKFNIPLRTTSITNSVAAFDKAKATENQVFELTDSICTYKSHIRVSSKHMSLASPVFKSMLQGGFREATELKKMGNIEIPLPDDDAASMLILVNIIHCCFKLVPKKLDLLTLTQVAVLVDKYQCHELIELLCIGWTEDICKNKSWLKSWNNIACWICVVWVLELGVEFKEATEVFIKSSYTSFVSLLDLEKLCLLIPQYVTDKMDQTCEQAINKLIKILGAKISEYQGTDLICSTDAYIIGEITDQHIVAEDSESIKAHRRYCDSLVLGCLIKGATQQSLFPLPQGPQYKSLIFKNLQSKIASLDIATGCFIAGGEAKYNHNISQKLKQSVAAVAAGVTGLRLADFKKSSRC